VDYDWVVQQTLAAIADGGLVERTQQRAAFGINPTCFRASLGGRPFEATVLVYDENLSSGHRLSGIGLRIPSPAPVRLLLGDAKTGSLSLPRVSTGDPGFDAAFAVLGVPDDVLRLAFDAEGRADVRASVRDPPNLWVEHGGGVLAHKVHFHVVDERGTIDTGPDAVRTEIVFAMRLSDRIARAFERVRAQVLARSGPAGEARWLADANTVVAAAAQRGERNRTIILLVVGGIFVVPLIVGLAIVVFVFVLK